MKRWLMLLLVLLLIPSGVTAEEPEDDDWRTTWEENGYFEFCDVQDNTLVFFEGVTALGEAETYYWDFEKDEGWEVEPKFESGPRFDYWLDGGGDISRVSLPSTLRFLGIEAFCYFHFDEFTLPAQLEVMEEDVFVNCSFDVLRIETTLPIGDILHGIGDSSVAAYEVPEDHPLYKTIDGVLFSRDGKTLLSYPDGREETHYDVPKGVERIEGIHNESLKTISLPIGLKSIGDYGFSGCTRLQSIALPLTVTEIGREIFHYCVSLELVSMPEGLQAERDESGRWEEYYPDDAIFRGDNGDTLSGERSAGSINAPGRVRFSENGYTTLYDSAGKDYSGRLIMSGQIVDMQRALNGLVLVTEPLTGRETGWVALEALEYLPQQGLFAYDDVQPAEVMDVWWNTFPNVWQSQYWITWETKIPRSGRVYTASFYGPFICFREKKSTARFGCCVQDVDLTRRPDGTDNVYGIVYNADSLKDIPLLAEPDGETLKMLCGGTQIRVLEEQESWCRVTDGRDTGWVGKDHVKIVPEKGKEK